MNRITKGAIRALIIVLICIASSLALALFIDFAENNVIEYAFALEMLITLFSMSLAVLAIFFTVIERRRDKMNERAKEILSKITNEMGENSISLLVLSCVLFTFSLIESVLPALLNEWVIISCYSLGFVTSLDVAIATMRIMKGMSH